MFNGAGSGIGLVTVKVIWMYNLQLMELRSMKYLTLMMNESPSIHRSSFKLKTQCHLNTALLISLQYQQSVICQ